MWTRGPEQHGDKHTAGVGWGRLSPSSGRAKANCPPCAGKSLENHLESFKHKASDLSNAPRQFSCLEDIS